MFYHVVLFKLKDSSEENLDKAKELLQSMEGKIPQLKGLTVGKDVLNSVRSYDICLITTFDSLSCKYHPEKFKTHAGGFQSVRFLRLTLP